MGKVLQAATIILLLVAGMLVQAQDSTIGVDDAKQLVGIVLRHQKFPSSSPYCTVENLDKNGEPFQPGYYAFGASCDFPNTPATSPWGTYLVSPRTGDVLNYDTCRWLSYSDLRQRQKQIMLKTGATRASEQKYRDSRGCDGNR
jgi:hypothetical protein